METLKWKFSAVSWKSLFMPWVGRQGADTFGRDVEGFSLQSLFNKFKGRKLRENTKLSKSEENQAALGNKWKRVLGQ